MLCSCLELLLEQTKLLLYEEIDIPVQNLLPKRCARNLLFSLRHSCSLDIVSHRKLLLRGYS